MKKNGKSWKREQAKGCFGSTKSISNWHEKKKRILSLAKKSRNGALKRGNVSMIKKRSAQITMIERSMPIRRRTGQLNTARKVHG